jgi:opacity protein-like surface antigen
MKVWGKAVLAAAAMCVLGTSAEGQDAMWSSVPTASNWTGFYIGAQAGLIGMKSHEKGTAVPLGEALLGDIPVTGGAFAGFHFQQTDWWVWGLDVEANYQPAEFFYNGTKFGIMDWDAAVRVQGGVPIAPNVLAYGSVGYSWAHFDQSTYYNGVFPAATGANYIGGGVQLGFGVDAKLNDHLMMRLLATWTNYGVHSITNGGVEVGSSEPSLINARVGLAWTF